MQEGQEAGKRPRGVAPRRQSTKALGDRRLVSRKKLRTSLHLEERVMTRIGVKASLVGRNVSALVNEILLRYVNDDAHMVALFGKIDLAAEEDPAEVPDTGYIGQTDAA